MSIVNDIRELDSIQMELKNLSLRSKVLRNKKSEVESRISEYIKSKDTPGVKMAGRAILLEEKEAREKKCRKDCDDESRILLSSFGVSEPEKALQALLEVRKGNKTSKTKLTIKKIKEKKGRD